MPGSTGEVSVPSSLDQRSPPPPGLRDGLVSRLGRLQCSSSTGPHTAAGGVEAESGASGDNTRWSLHLHSLMYPVFRSLVRCVDAAALVSTCSHLSGEQCQGGSGVYPVCTCVSR